MIKTTQNLLPEERLELENGIELTSKSLTPFVDLLFGNGRVESVNSTEFSWLEEDRIDADEPVGIKEVSGYEEMTFTQRRLNKNYVQIFRMTAAVPDSLNAMTTAAGNELLTKLNHARDIVKTQMEKAFLYGVKKAEDEVSGRQTDGLANLVGYTLDVNPDNIMPQRLTKNHIEDVLFEAYSRGFHGEKIMMLNAYQKKVVDSLYADGNTKQYLPGNNTVGDPLAEKIITNYGTISILLNPKMPFDEIYFFDPSKVVIKRLRPLTVVDNLAKTDSTTRRAIEGEYGLKLEDRFHASKIIGLTTSDSDGALG